MVYQLSTVKPLDDRTCYKTGQFSCGSETGFHPPSFFFASPFRDVDSSHGDWKKYTLSTVPSVRHPNRHLYTGYIRRRRGRGGRVMCDRITLPRHVSEFLGSHDEAVQMYATPSERTAEKASRCTTTTISSPLPHLPMAKDEVLFRRLKTLILSTSRGRASYAWPLCTKSHSPTFEPLSPDPLTLMTADSPSPAVPPSASNYVSPVHRRQTSKQSTLLFPDHTSRVVSDGGDTDHSLLDNQPTIGSNDRGPLSLRTKRNFSLTVPSVCVPANFLLMG